MDENNTKPGKWTLPLYQERPPCPTGDLCTVCDALYTRLLRPQAEPEDITEDEDRNQPFTIGWVDRMLATKYCSLCTFLVSLFTRNEVDLAGFTERYRVLCVMPFGNFETTADGLRADWNLQAGFISCEEIDSDSETRSVAQSSLPDVHFNLNVESLGSLQNLSGTSSNRVEFLHLGRIVNEDISENFLRDAVQTCQKYHGVECTSPKSVLEKTDMELSRPDLGFLRVIDVQERCLVNLPADESYVALSYTWSSEPFLSLTQDTFAGLQLRDGITVDALPPTISDAITVVAILGERYLWADRLCIIQDSPEDKSVQIGRMGEIYRHASLSIVAASSDADGRDIGLPGIRSKSRVVDQKTTSIRGLGFVETNTYLENVIDRSRWQKRCWTFQESVLSKRHLVFTPDRAGWFCSRDVFLEDYVWQVCYDSGNAVSEYSVPPSTDDIIASGISGSVVAYEPLVRMYTQRNLTNDSDIMKGVSGLLRVITSETGVRFLCGLPMSDLLNHFLLWLPRDKSWRRCPTSSGQPFPSWSWAGWVGGPVTYPVSGDFFDGRAKLSFSEEPMIDGYTVLIPMVDDTFREYAPEDLPDETLLSLESCRLSFIAASATVFLSTLCWGYFSDCDDSAAWGHVSRCNQIYVNGSFAGMLQRSLDMHCLHLRGLQKLIRDTNTMTEDPESYLQTGELIALSSTSIPWAVYFPNSMYEQDNSNFYYVGKDGEERDHLPFDVEVWSDEDPELVNVMLIKWDGDVAVRAGLGQMHADAWGMAEKTQRAVILA